MMRTTTDLSSLVVRTLLVLGILGFATYFAFERSKTSQEPADEWDGDFAELKEMLVEKLLDGTEKNNYNTTVAYVGEEQLNDDDDDTFYMQEDNNDEYGDSDDADSNADGNNDDNKKEIEERDEEPFSDEDDDEDEEAGDDDDAVMSAEKLELRGFQKQNVRLDLPCHLKPATSNNGDKAPIPVVLMSLGRSGSGSTWQIMGTLTGREVPSLELTGGSTTSSLQFFDNLNKDKDGLWILRYMCHVQKKFNRAGIVGFKWKPFYRAITTDPAQGALRLIANYDGPPIYVVRNRRNLLDVLISREKHHGDEHIPAHCPRGDKECIALQKRAGTNMELPTETLLHDLKALTRDEDAVDQMLMDMGVPHVQVSYEKLYFGDERVEEWRKIFLLIGRGPRRLLTEQKLRRAMHHKATANPEHKVTLGNYKEVRDILSGTEYEGLLHRRHLLEVPDSEYLL